MSNRTSLLQRWLESVWYDSGKGRLLLMPFSYLYSVINNYQRKTQTKNIAKLTCPVIVVGNITVGGTGKTPLTIYIVKLLAKKGYKPAIITRGYGGKATKWPQAVTANSEPNLVGDEAVLMAQNTDVPVYAGPNRLESVEQLLKAHNCDVIVSDDGMQHYKLPRDIQIALIDGERLFGNGYCLPAGPLREKKERLNSCDFLVLNGENSSFNKPYFEMKFSGITLINLYSNEEKQITDFNDKKIQALTGIGNPQRFYSTLKANGLNIRENSFPDHHAFVTDDLAFSDDSIIIMTEKDAVKCKTLVGNSNKYWYLPVTANLSNDFDNSLLTKLKNINVSYNDRKY